MTLNLTAKIDTVEDGVARLRLRGGPGNPIIETWHIFDAGFTGFHAERYDDAGDLIVAAEAFSTPGEALHWLSDRAYETHQPDSLTTAPAKLTRVMKQRGAC